MLVVRSVNAYIEQMTTEHYADMDPKAAAMLRDVRERERKINELAEIKKKLETEEIMCDVALELMNSPDCPKCSFWNRHELREHVRHVGKEHWAWDHLKAD